MESISNIIIKTIPHKEQRYDTVGDWFFEGDTLQIRVSSMRNPYYEWLIAAHEVDEALLCHKDGITQKEVDDFDMNFKGEGEPGDDVKAPYFMQHQQATILEASRARAFDVDWMKYEEAVLDTHY